MLVRRLTCCLLLSLASASTLQELSSYAPCLRAHSPWPCIKERALALFDKALLTDSIEITRGLVLERNAEERSFDFDASDELDLPFEPLARETRLDELLWKRVVTFFSTRSVSFDSDDISIGGRLFKKKIKKFVIPLLLLKLGLTFVATKALIIGKIALALTIFVMIREFIEERKKTQHETYEVFAKHPSSEQHGDYHQFDASSPVVQTTANGFYPTKGRENDQVFAHNAAFAAQRPS